MNKNMGNDLTIGSIPKHLLAFAIPMLLGNLLQIGFSIVNTIWIGNIVGENAIGATTLCFNVMFVFISLASGATLGTSILVSRYFGAKDYEMVEKVANNAFSIALIMGLSFSIAGVCTSDLLLRLLDTPPDMFVMSSTFLKLCFSSFLLMYLTFLVGAFLRGVGDTKTPMIYILIGLIINAILDPLLIGGFGPFPKLGLNGAAIASIISQIIVLILGIRHIQRNNKVIAFRFQKLNLNLQLTYISFKIGFPSMMQQSLVALSSVFVTSFVNSFGSSAINAFGAVSKIDAFAYMPAISMGIATSALTAQNLGANKSDRVKDIFKYSVIITSIITIVISGVINLFPHQILSAFGMGQDVDTIHISISYIGIVGSTYLLYAILLIAEGVITGAGQTTIPLLFSVLSVWIIRVPLAAALSKTGLGVTGIWLAIVISSAATLVICLLYYHSKRWVQASKKQIDSIELLRYHCLNQSCRIYQQGNHNKVSECATCPFNYENTFEEKALQAATANVFSTIKKRAAILSAVSLCIMVGVVFFMMKNNIIKPSVFNQNSNDQSKQDALKASSTNNGIANDGMVKIQVSDITDIQRMASVVQDYIKIKGGNTTKQEQRYGSGTDITFTMANEPSEKRVSITLQNNKDQSSFEDFENNKCDLLMLPRKIREDETNELVQKNRGDFSVPSCEKIIALDGIAIIVNPNNPVTKLKMGDLVKILGGQIKDWSEVGGKHEKMTICQNDDINKACYETIQSVIGGNEKPILPRSESGVAEKVAKDENAIAFVRVSEVGYSKALAITDTNTPVQLPNQFNLATEEYPLTMRIYLYSSPVNQNALCREIEAYLLSQEGQESIQTNMGYISQKMYVQPTVNIPEVTWKSKADKNEFDQLLRNSFGRLSMDIRFSDSNYKLDSKSNMDLVKLAKFLNEPQYIDTNIVLIGYSYEADKAYINKNTALVNAKEVVAQLGKIDSNLTKRMVTAGFGDEGKLSGSKTVNNRVEVWLVQK